MSASAMNVVYRRIDKSIATIRTRGMLMGNLLALTSSKVYVEFDLQVEAARELFGKMFSLSQNDERAGGTGVPMSYTIDTLDKGPIVLDSQGFLELSGALAIVITDADISEDDLIRYPATRK